MQALHDGGMAQLKENRLLRHLRPAGNGLLLNKPLNYEDKCRQDGGVTMSAVYEPTGSPPARGSHKWLRGQSAVADPHQPLRLPPRWRRYEVFRARVSGFSIRPRPDVGTATYTKLPPGWRRYKVCGVLSTANGIGYVPKLKSK